MQASHYIDVIMTTMASQITSLTVVYSTVYSDADQRKHQSSASLAFVWGIHRDRWIPRTKDQLRGNCFHLMTSSWSRNNFSDNTNERTQSTFVLFQPSFYEDVFARNRHQRHGQVITSHRDVITCTCPLHPSILVTEYVLMQCVDKIYFTDVYKQPSSL